MIDNIELIAQSALRIIYNDKIIYFDPFKINGKYHNDADYIFITHSHYDHFSLDDIKSIIKDDTAIIVTVDLEDKVKSLIEKVLVVIPNNEYEIDGIKFKTVPSYNNNKDFHKKEYNWVGYIINLNNEKIYIAGDTDNIKELHEIKCDIACVPVGGTYTMNYNEAVDLIKNVKPKYAIPIHYKTIIGSSNDAINFKNSLQGIADVRILMK